MRRILLILCTMGTLIINNPALAAEVIKSVDESGNISYSNKATADSVSSETVEITPGPSQEEMERARNNLEKTRNMNKELEQARKDLEKERRDEKASRAASQPEVVIINESGGYPTYRRPVKPARPPGSPPGSKGDHPAYKPGVRPPSVKPRPLPVTQ